MKVNASSLEKGLAMFENRAMTALGMYAETAAKKLEGYAKEHAPWTDRTAHARQRLKGSHERTSKGYRIVLSHGVDYGLWLEIAHEKRFAILQPTIEHMSPEIIRGMDRLIERMGG